MSFEFDMEVRSSVIAHQHVGERGDAGSRESFPKPGPGVKRLESGKRLASHWTSTVRRPVHGIVMDHDEGVVAGQVYVKFQMGGTHLECQVKGSHGVLWGIGRCAPMRND